MATHRQGSALPVIKKLTQLSSVCALSLPIWMPQIAWSNESIESINNPSAAELPTVTVNSQSTSPTTEGSDAYTSHATQAGTGLLLSPRETPQSVTVITRQRMDDQRLGTIRDVLENTTGVSASVLDSERVNFYSRGFNITNLQYDGIPTTVNAFAPGEGVLDTAFYDRVEVVRGATGLLQGIGEPSASVNLVRKRPLREFSANGSIGLGSWNDRHGMLDLSSPLTSDGRIRARVVGSYQKRDSFLDYYRNERQALYGIVEADLTPQTTLNLGHEYQQNQPRGATWGGLPLFHADGTRADWSRSTNPGARWNRWDSRLNTTFAGIEHQADNGWTLRAKFDHKTSVASADLLSVNGSPDRTTGLGTYPFFLNGGLASQQNNVDAQATGPVQLWGRTHELVIGANSSRQSLSNDYALGFVPGLMLGNFNEWNGDYPRQPYADRPTTRTSVKQSGLYAAARLSIADPLKLIVGARVSNYELNDSIGNHYKKTGHISPYAGVIYELDDQWSVYASYTEVFKPQAESRDRTGQVLPAMKGQNKELGVKAELLDRRVNASFAVFETSADNVAQIDNGQLLPDGSQAYYAANGTKTRGFDMEVQGAIRSGWNLAAGLTHFTASDGTGNRLNSQIPRSTARLFTTYRLPGDGNRLTVGGGVNWQSRFYQQAIHPSGQSVQAGQRSYALASLMARYELTDTTAISLNVNNLLDRTYYASAGFQNGYLYGEPRSVQVHLTYRTK